MRKNIKNYYKVMLGFLVFFIFSFFIALIAKFGLGVDFSTNRIQKLVKFDFVCSLLITLMLSTIFFPKIKNDLLNIKTKYGKLYKFIIKVFIAFLILMLIKIAGGAAETIIETLLHIGFKQTDNQATIESMLNSLPAMMIISTIFFAPIEEEVLFRCGIRQIIKNKRVFVTVSGLIFGTMHVTDSLTFLGEVLLLGVVIDLILDSKMNKRGKMIVSVAAIAAITILFGGIYYFQYGNLLEYIKTIELTEVVGGITYIIGGMTFAYFYVKEDNIWFTIFMHMLHNGFACLMLLFI